MGLKGRGVIVAASSQGIGLATAEAFAREGAQVAMCARTEKTLSKPPTKLRSQTGAEIYAEALDVTDATPSSALRSRWPKRFGRIDVCVTNAGGPPAKNFLSISADEWRKAVEYEFDEHSASGQSRDSLHAAPSLGKDHYHYFNFRKAADCGPGAFKLSARRRCGTGQEPVE